MANLHRIAQSLNNDWRDVVDSLGVLPFQSSILPEDMQEHILLDGDILPNVRGGFKEVQTRLKQYKN